jgi:hypothetical protein
MQLLLQVWGIDTTPEARGQAALLRRALRRELDHCSAGSVQGAGAGVAGGALAEMRPVSAG